MSASDLTFRRLLFDGRVTPELVDDVLRRLAQSDAPRPLVLETRAVASEVGWFVGTTKSQLPTIRQLLGALIPHARLTKLSKDGRPSMTTVRRLRLTRLGVPLDIARPEEVTRAVFAAFEDVHDGEELRLQAVFGFGHGPELLHAPVVDPTISLSEALLTGVDRPAPARLARRLEERASAASLDLTLRLGVRAGHPERRRQLLLSLLGALQLLETAGMSLSLSQEPAFHLDLASRARFRPTRLSTPEVIPLLGWPIGDKDLPGLPLAPRRPLAPPRLERRENIFATTSAPGYERPVGLTTETVLHHVVVTGPTGSGKSTVIAVIAEQWIRAGRPLALLDPKRQLVDHLLARLPASAAGRVVVLDASATDHVVGFNPLDTAGRNADVVVDGILSSLKALFEDGWGPRTEDLLLAGLRSLALAGEQRGEPYTLIDLPHLLANAAVRRAVVGQVQGDSVLASFWSAFEEQSAGARAAMVAAPLNKLRKFLLRPNLVAVLGQARPTSRLRDLFQTDRALLVPLNDALLGPGAAQLLGSLIVAELFQATQERAAEAHPEQHPGLIAIDEAQRFIHLPTALDDALATSRGYGVGWLGAHQYRGQLSPTLRAGFDANARTKLVFAPRPDDARDYARMSRALTPDDFMSLDAYEMYVTLLHGHTQTPWFSARSLPPKPELGHDEQIRQASQRLFGAPLTPQSQPVVTPPDVPTGRKRRQA